MKKDPLVFLRHILDSINAIEEYTNSLSKKEFLINQEKQDAVVRRIEIIGEATKNLPKEFKLLHSDIVWIEIAGMRDKLIHKYFGVDLNVVWKVVIKDLPPFKEKVKNIIDEAKNQPQK